MHTPYDVRQMKTVFHPAAETLTTALPPIAPDPAFERLLAQSGTWCYSVDFRTGRFRYVSPGIQRMLGYDRAAWQFGGMDSFFHRVHPEDRECLRKIHHEILRLLRKYPVDQRCGLTFVFTCRVYTVDGRVVQLSHQLVFPELDAAGDPLTGFTVVADITALKTPITCLLHVKQGTARGEEPCHTLVFPYEETVNFSPRELEVLRLLVAGLRSEDIARQLYISYNTVCTHRKNLLRKAGVKGTVELVGYARGLGLVG